MAEATYASSGNAGIDTLVSRADIATKVIIATLALFVMTLLGELLELAGVLDLEAITLDTPAMIYVFISIGSGLAFLVSVIFVAMWIYRAHANLHEAGIDGLSYTPGWAVGWYFIPIANLFKPFQAMRELWSESHGAGDSFAAAAPGNLGAWWAAWIIGNILGNVSMRLSMAGDGSNMQVAIVLAAASSVGSIISAYLLMQIIRDITAAQVNGLNVAQIFAKDLPGEVC